MSCHRFTPFFLLSCCLLAVVSVSHAQQIFVRVTLLEPTDKPYKVQLDVHPSYFTNQTFFAGQTISKSEESRYVYLPAADVLKTLEDAVQPVAAGQATVWVELTKYIPAGSLASVQFFFSPAKDFQQTGVKARFDVATAADEQNIVRSITEHDNTGNVITLRIPHDLVKDKPWLISVREDSVRRLNEIKSFNLPEGPLPKKIWCMTGFRPWNMYTDPTITESDFQVIHALGMNGYWDFTPETWKLAPKYGIDRTTVYWRSVGAPPGFPGKIQLKWPELEKWIDDAYKRDIESTKKIFDGKIPMAVADMNDEPAGVAFVGPEYDAEFVKFLQEQKFTPDFFGKKSWDDVKAIRTDAAYFWWDFFTTRQKLDMKDIYSRRLFYWSGYFLAYVNTRLFTLANSAVQKYAPEIAGTRVNIGPPWWYDYGSIPRGMDNFAMGRMHGISMPFNEDWIGNGDPRWPLEITSFLADWDRAPFRPGTPLAGGYITRDANRTAVKLRVQGFLARDCKVFDFYYYGPAYGQFDHWSDNSPMVQGVAELTRDIGRADAILWAAHPPKAKVALLFPKSFSVWKEDDTEQVEFMMTYVALLHAGIPVDIVSDDEVSDGTFAKGGYKCLYVVNESVPTRAAEAIAQWVKSGGKLWAAGWAAAKDEYYTPVTTWNAMLGIKERSWKAVGDLKRYGDLIKYADERRPYFTRQSNLLLADGKALTGEKDTYRQKYGKGLVQLVSWTAGKDYIDGCQKVDGTIARGANVFPSDARRDIIAALARESVTPPAITSVSQIVASPLWAKKQGVVLLANYTGNPAENVTVTFQSPLTVRTVTSLRTGKLKFKRHHGTIECTLPVRDVTDMLIVNE